MTGVVIALVCIVASPFVLFFCAKFATLGFYKAKQFVEKESKH